MEGIKRFRHSGPHIIHERFDDEVVIINLKSGTYYSLENSGIILWGLLNEGSTLAEITTTIASRYRCDGSNIQAELEDFLGQLVQEGLIAEYEGETDSRAEFEGKVEGIDQAEAMESFEPPVLKKYTDQQELLLLDPIHEVDDLGWPHKKTKE